MRADARDRRSRFQERLAETGVEAAIVTDRANFTYLCGYLTPSWENRSRPMALVIRADGPVHAFLSEAEAPRLAEWDDEITPVGYTSPSQSPGPAPGVEYAAAVVDAIVTELGRSSPRRIATEESGPAGLPRASVAALSDRLAADLVDLDALLWPLRLRKTSFEIMCIREAGAALGRAFEAFARRATPGMTERELHAEFMAAASESGGDPPAYLVVVAGTDQPMLGPPTDRIWGDGELLAVDACMTRDAFWADFCRHYAASDPTPAQTSAYGRLIEGLDAGRQAVGSGVTADAAATAIGAALDAGSPGFGRFGHGIGLDLAEPPSIHPADRTRIDQGMTLCIEPSARYEGAGQLVAEEMVAISPSGAELLSPAFPAELEVLAR